MTKWKNDLMNERRNELMNEWKINEQIKEWTKE